jgi:isopentenyldiphosphate isomerase
MINNESCCNNEHIKNTILLYYGPILVVVINGMVKQIFKQVTRRLFEEMGFKTNLKELFHFIYKAPFDNGLTEHELDHVMIGYYNDKPIINPDEVEDWKWMKIEDVKEDMIQIHPEIIYGLVQNYF